MISLPHAMCAGKEGPHLAMTGAEPVAVKMLRAQDCDGPSRRNISGWGSVSPCAPPWGPGGADTQEGAAGTPGLSLGAPPAGGPGSHPRSQLWGPRNLTKAPHMRHEEQTELEKLPFLGGCC